MKIKVTEKNYSEVIALPGTRHLKPIKQKAPWRKLMKTLAAKELKEVNFTCKRVGMEQLGKEEPALFLMNHSSFTDLEITSQLLADRQYHIVMTNDGMVGKAALMQKIGCIEAKKFIIDTTLIRDMKYCVDKLKSSILMYPEASYSFDGTQTDLPDSIGKCIKLLKVPVVMIRTKGAFLRDPLYNNLQKRQVNVSAEMSYVLSPKDIQEKSVQEINAIIKRLFSYNHFQEQIDAGISIREAFRADGLERVLYKCCCCGAEGAMKGNGTKIRCAKCGDTHELCEDGRLKNELGETSFELIPDWYKWEREQVREEIEAGTYEMDLEVDIMMLVDYKSMYKVGHGRLIHNQDGFKLTGCEGQLSYTQGVKQSYSLYADYYWYEIGDMISIGDTQAQYYCFPRNQEAAIVAKARLAAEELYKHE